MDSDHAAPTPASGAPQSGESLAVRRVVETPRRLPTTPLLGGPAVFCAELNAVRAKHLWPRSLLTPFTGNVQPDRADKSAYTAYAQAEQYEAFEIIDVTFPPPSTRPVQPHECPTCNVRPRGGVSDELSDNHRIG